MHQSFVSTAPPPPTYRGWVGIMIFTFQSPGINSALWGQAEGPPGVLRIWGEWLFTFRELGSTCNYFQGFGEQAHSFGDLGSPAKNSKKKSHLKGKAFISFDFQKISSASGGKPPAPLRYLIVYTFVLT